MTKTEWKKAERIAREYGEYKPKDGDCVIYYRGNGVFAVYSNDGNCIDVDAAERIKGWIID